MSDGQGRKDVVLDAGQLGGELRDKGSAGYKKQRLISPAQRVPGIDGGESKRIFLREIISLRNGYRGH